MGKVLWKPGTFEYPIPAVMVSCGTMKKSTTKKTSTKKTSTKKSTTKKK